MLTSAEVKAATSVVDKILSDILVDHNGQPRKREQVRLIADILETATDACTVPTCIGEAFAISLGNIKP